MENRYRKLKQRLQSGNQSHKNEQRETPSREHSRYKAIKSRIHKGGITSTSTAKQNHSVPDTKQKQEIANNFQQTTTQPTGLVALAQQVETTRTNAQDKQTAAKNAYQVYVSFIDQPIDTTYSILDDGGAASAAAEQQRKKLWTSYQQANDAALEAQALYEKALETYTSRMATAERDGYYAMDLGELKTLLDNTKTDVETKRTAAVTAQNSYNAFLDQPVTGNFLEEDMSLSADMQAQQQSLLQTSMDATNILNQAMETHDLIEDVYNERNDMLTISGMTETEKIALEIYHNGINIKDTAHMINSLTREQRAQLRNTGKLFQILTNPKKYLRSMGYTEADIPRLAETYGRYLNAEDMQQLLETSEASAREHPVLHTIVSYPAKAIGDVTGGLTALGGTIWHDMGLSNYNSIDVNAPGYIPMVYADTVRDSVSDDLGYVGGTVYDCFNDVVDSGLRNWALGPIGAGVVDAMGSFGSSARDTAMKGGTSQDAFLMGAANTGVDLLLNSFSVDKLLNTKFAGKWQSLLDYSISGAEELTQEELRYLGNLAAQTALLAEKSDFEVQVAALMQTGMSEEDAKREVYKSIFQEMEYIALVSQVSNSLSFNPHRPEDNFLP